ncbi:MAG: SDR family oxidoreductase [Proteobacteria bacterium]|nr:SDR family oxidoreductase [Pseudomonadota bacterium]
MKLIIFGATGSIGYQVVEKSLAQGHQVSAFARNPSTLNLEHPNLMLTAGDVLNKDLVTNTIKDHDAVIITLGAGIKGNVRSVGTENIIEGMKQHGIRRVVCLSTLGAGDSHDTLNFFWKYIMFGILLRQALADHEAQEEVLKNSGLDWIIVRPAAFTDGPATGIYKHGELDPGKNLKLKVSRDDIADFIIKCLSDDTYLHKTPGLSY